MTQPTEPAAPPAPDPADETTAALRAEAARHRTAARAAETARDTAIAERDAERARITAWQRRDVEALAGGATGLVRPADLFDVGGADLTTLVADDGSVDQAALTAALEQLRTDRPYLFNPLPQRVPGPDHSLGGRPQGPTTSERKPTIADVIAGRAVPARFLDPQ